MRFDGSGYCFLDSNQFVIRGFYSHEKDKRILGEEEEKKKSETNIQNSESKLDQNSDRNQKQIFKNWLKFEAFVRGRNHTAEFHRNSFVSVRIEEITNVQNLTLWLEKVKAYSGVIHNETADQLARESCLKPVYFPNLQSLTSVNAVSCWNAETIEEPLKHFTKKLDTAKHSIKWRLLNRNVSTISAFKSKQIQWELLWRTTMLSYIDYNVTDNKETRQKAFNVKLFNNELFTLEKLKDRFPKIYESDSCIWCNLEKED
ncbi:hypothetical protein Glove_23g64 [Diversispora epigaea]|uniref:RNase H type-1 domain-containing protein n=1 Tax=Diversispora epigaea TaxID=1348612 RepID=A0A397JV84_9GLOM|nr:hypothetical protein Glove_23g64 [Diversispora epigaea]